MNKMNLIDLLMQDPEAVAALEQAFASRNQAPGMGSTANALPHQNQFVDDRRYYTDMYEDAWPKSLMGYGGALATMAKFPGAPVPALLTAGGLGAYGAYQAVREGYGKHNARKLGYQGN